MLHIQIGDLVLQPHRQLMSGGERVALGKRALDILSVLGEANGEIVTKEELFEAVWPGVIVEENALQVHIVALRKALGAEADRLETIRGIGYRLNAAEEPAPVLPWPLRRTVQAGLAVAIFLGLAAIAWFAFSGDTPLRPGGRTVEVMVMPFTAASTNAEETALANGITDELIVRMRRVPELEVVTGWSHAPADNSLSADRRLEGSVRLHERGLRVSARLMDSRGRVIWSQNFDRQISDLLQVQEDIARAVADELSVSLDVGVDSRSYGGTDNPEAFANYVQGSSRLFEDDSSLAIAYLERAVALDSGYVKGLAALSDVYGFSRNQVSSRQEDQERLRKQGAASASALRANPEIWQGHAARSYYELGRGNLSAAQAHYLRAAALDPGRDPEAKDALANLASEFGLIRKAVEFRRSKALIDPYYRTDSRLVGDLVLADRYAEASMLFEALPEESLAIHPGVVVDAFWAYLLSGDADRARELANQGMLFPPYRRVPSFQFNPVDMPDPSAVDLRQWADKEFGGGGRPNLVFLALLAAHNGQQAAALEYLKLAHRRTGAYGYRFLWHPALADLRRTEGFRQLVTDLGLVEAWRKSGVWSDYCRPDLAGEVSCY